MPLLLTAPAPSAELLKPWPHRALLLCSPALCLPCPQDLSSNGTFLNNARLPRSAQAPLADGDRVSLVLSVAPLAEQAFIFRKGGRAGSPAACCFGLPMAEAPSCMATRGSGDLCAPAFLKYRR